MYRDAGYATWSFASNSFTGEMTNLHQGFEEVHEAGSLPDRRSSKTARIGMDRLFPWLEAHRDGPFFAFLSVLDPHDPFKPNPPYDTLWADPAREKEHERQTEAARKHIAHPILRLFGMPGRDELLKGGVDPEAYVAHNVDWYDGSIRGMDAEMGRLRERLRALDLERDTLVVFVSDHGEEFLEHGWTFHGQSTYGELSLVPLILWGPGHLPKGRVVEETVSTIDIMPTLLAFAGLDQAGMQGQSLVPLVGPEAPARSWSPRPALTERLAARDDVPPLDGEAFAIVVDDWKLIHNTKRRPPRPEFELFRFREDPLDQKNVAGERPEVVARLARELDAWRKTAAAGRLKPDAETARALGAEELERLRALGYVQ